ncbi:MAG: hypothetical protein QNK23_00870 [Crocinitomicaceae bacterium]|nr:hypothetical protein [Crocinitomicaceae bacterium]
MNELSDEEYSKLISDFQDYLNENYDSKTDMKTAMTNWLKAIDRDDALGELLGSGN